MDDEAPDTAEPMEPAPAPAVDSGPAPGSVAAMRREIGHARAIVVAAAADLIHVPDTAHGVFRHRLGTLIDLLFELGD